VTVADLGVQAVVSAALEERFGHDPLMAEEESRELRQPEWNDLLVKVTEHVRLVRRGHTEPAAILDWIERGQQAIDPEKRYWVLDPVDGTKGFLRKEQYAIALALVERGQVLLGRGDSLGARASLRVSANSDPRLARWCERVESSDKNHDVTAQVVERVGIQSPPDRLDSQAKYAVVARGEAALYLRHSLSDYREKVWDHAAGVLITEEAGGRVTDVAGRSLDFSKGRELSANKGIVATNGLLHDRVLAAVNDVIVKLSAR
jgi:3'(2'), 5'-bisphosphate nucleotidase